MSSPSNKSAMAPLFTREMFNKIEADLAKQERYIEIQTIGGKTIQRKTQFPLTAPGDVIPGVEQVRDTLYFNGERLFRRLEAQGLADSFVAVFNGPLLFSEPNYTVEETRQSLATVIQTFEASAEAKAINNLVKMHLCGSAVDKVVLFGAGFIGHAHQGLYDSLYEHAAALVVAKAARETVLGEFGVEVVDGFGAKAFALVDDRSIVISHHSNYPFREIIADLARPALICMLAEEESEDDSSGLLADVTSVRSRKMLEEYHVAPLEILEPKGFYDNTWYIRTQVENHE
ncbi:hypothetical protein F4861DRAFT_25648 [Xylaria intraflava]|nr:hypothetical protein F4861DRAFT_25648 [Xylaria intraflava]